MNDVAVKLSTEYMHEDKFWELVEMVKWPCDYNRAKIKYLKVMSKEESKAFRKTKSLVHNILDSVASHIEDLGCSDDGYNDLLNHIIGLGKIKFNQYVHNPDMILELARTRGYEESFAYCIPYDSDYDTSGNSPFSLAHAIKMAKESKKEIARFAKLDCVSYSWNHLRTIGEDLDKIKNLMTQFLANPNESGLKELVKHKKFVSEACERINKFFAVNRMELPRKFTDGNGFCSALIENTLHDAELALEFLDA